MADFFAFYFNGIMKFLHWFTVPTHLFGLFVFGFPLFSLLGFLVSAYCAENSESVLFTVFFVLFTIGIFVFLFLGIPFLCYLS